MLAVVTNGLTAALQTEEEKVQQSTRVNQGQFNQTDGVTHITAEGAICRRRYADTHLCQHRPT